MGYYVMIGPEVPTMIMQSGARFPGDGSLEDILEYECNMLKLVIQTHETIINIVNLSKSSKKIVIFDR